MGNNELPWNKKCTEEKCEGEVDFDNYTTLKTGCHSFATAYACNGCGRLHFKDEENQSFTAVINRQEKKVFLLPDGNIDLRD